MIRLKRSDPTPLYLQVKESLRKEVLAGRFLIDHPIPDERTLASELGLSRMTVRRAIVELTDEGLFDRIPGRGTFVRRPAVVPAGQSAPAIPDAPNTPAAGAVQLGLVMRSKTIDPRDSLFYYRTLQGMHQEGALGASIAVRTLYPNQERELVAQLAQDPSLSGLIVVGFTDQPTLALMLQTGKPVAFFDCAQPVASGAYDFVTHASEDGGFQAVSALLDLGHREIAFLVHGTSNDPREAVIGEIAKERQNGYERAFLSRGLPLPEHRFVPAVPCGSYTYEAVSTRFKRTDLPRPTALACTTDDGAVGAIAAVRDFGLRVPEDVSVVGFGDLGLFSVPPLSTIGMQLEASGAAAVRMLRERLVRPQLPTRHEIFPVEYLARGTTAPLRGA